jgi:hypothetical protein
LQPLKLPNASILDRGRTVSSVRHDLPNDFVSLAPKVVFTVGFRAPWIALEALLDDNTGRGFVGLGELVAMGANEHDFFDSALNKTVTSSVYGGTIAGLDHATSPNFATSQEPRA